MGKGLAERPGAGQVVPAVVEQEGIDLHPALDAQFFTEGMDTVQRIGFGIGGVIADIVPGIVVQEGAIGVGAFRLDIVEKVAAQLAGGTYTHNRGNGQALALAQWERIVDPHGCLVVFDEGPAFRQRILEHQVVVADDDGRAGDLAVDLGARRVRFQQCDLRNDLIVHK